MVNLKSFHEYKGRWNEILFPVHFHYRNVYRWLEWTNWNYFGTIIRFNVKIYYVIGCWKYRLSKMIVRLVEIKVWKVEKNHRCISRDLELQWRVYWHKECLNRGENMSILSWSFNRWVEKFWNQAVEEDFWYVVSNFLR